MRQSLPVLRGQMAEYEDLLKDIQEENEKGKDSTARMERSAAAINKHGGTDPERIPDGRAGCTGKGPIGRMSAGADRLEEEMRRLSETSGSSVSLKMKSPNLNMGMTSLGDSINRLNRVLPISVTVLSA